MDEFLKIDWNPPLEDMLEGPFVNMDRFVAHGTLYKALRGNFYDPFADLHEDFEPLVTKDHISEIFAEKSESNALTKNPKLQPSAAEAECSVAHSQPTEQDLQEKAPREYVPGIIKNHLQFPKCSELTAQQHALCLKVLLRFSGSEKPSISPSDMEEMQTYMNLMPTINKEQEAFLEFVKGNWDSSKFDIQEEEFINSQWKKKVKRVDSLPRYYVETENIPLVSSIKTVVNFQLNCLEMGVVPKVFLPNVARRVLMPPNTPKMNQRFFSINNDREPQKNVIFKTPVSEDPNCAKLAQMHDADLVISSGGLDCLALNIDPNITTSWILPVVVKSINDKNVVFIDKPLPPTGLTVLQKNAWLHKYNVKSHLAHPYHCGAAKFHGDLDKPEDDEEPFPQNEEMDADASNTEQGVENPEETQQQDRNFVPPPAGHNLFYRLFSISSSDESQNELMKNRADKTYKLLVRAKMDGILKTNSGEEYLTMIAAKVEHQLALGAETVSVEEAAKQWMSLTFRPGTSLLRIRMDAKSMEFIQFEKRTALSINNEIQRIYSLKTEAALTLLYNVVDTMSSMDPGQYVIRHTPRNPTFACVYKNVDEPGKNVFDLQTLYWGNEFPTIPNPPWPPLDKVVVTPALKVFKRMPAMFHPPRYSKLSKKSRGGKSLRGSRGGRGGKGNRGGKGQRGGAAAAKTADRGQKAKNPNAEG